MLRYQPLLRQQRELYSVPRGPHRFRVYLSMMLNEAQNEMELPLAVFNPMGREAVATCLDRWIALGADEIAEQAIREAEAQGNQLRGDFRLALVLCDDKDGGWTNHAATEFSRRFETGALLRRGWIEGALWTSQEPSPQLARESILVAFFRAVYIERCGEARTLQEMLAQESFAAQQAGYERGSRDDAQEQQVREVVARHSDSTQWSILMACLFGDEVAGELGLPPIGMPGGGALELLV